MRAHRAAVIMAGGVGERFWPLSRRTRPKQLLPLAGTGTPLLVDAIRRLRTVIPPEHTFVITGKHLVAPIRSAQQEVPPRNVLSEPHKRNTTGCLIYAVAALLQRFQCSPRDLTLGVLAADHLIGDTDEFHKTVRTAFDVAEAEDVLVTIGVKPTRPETGYGYIEVDSTRDPVSRSLRQPTVHTALRFREKPDQATAEAYLAASRFFWNSGMFFWRASTFLEQLAQADPVLGQTACRVIDAFGAGDAQSASELFATLPNLSIDYALMERASDVRVVSAAFAWDDIGAWDALGRCFPEDSGRNVGVGNPVLIDTKGSIVYCEPGSERMAVAVVGMSDVVVVATGDAVLVMPRNRAQDVRAVVEELRRRNAPQM